MEKKKLKTGEKFKYITASNDLLPEQKWFCRSSVQFATAQLDYM